MLAAEVPTYKGSEPARRLTRALALYSFGAKTGEDRGVVKSDLLAATPRLELGWHPPEVQDAPRPVTGCPNRTRCPRAEPRCAEEPQLEDHRDDCRVACWFPLSD